MNKNAIIGALALMCSSFALIGANIAKKSVNVHAGTSDVSGTITLKVDSLDNDYRYLLTSIEEWADEDGYHNRFKIDEVFTNLRWNGKTLKYWNG